MKIITGITNDPQEDFQDYTRRTGIPITVIKELRREINPFLDLTALCKLYKVINKKEPNIVHTHTSKAGILGRWAAWFSGVKVIIHSTHGHVFYGYFYRLKTTFFLWVERLTAGITDRITTLTDLEIEDYQKLGLAEREKYITLPYGIDTEAYIQSDVIRGKTRNTLGFSSNDPLIGWVGRFVPVKDCSTFLSAAAIVKNVRKDIKLLIVGDGTERIMLEEKARELGLKAIFTGMRDDIRDIMCAIDIFVLSSLNEGLGHVILEAMAAGRPVIATKVGGVPEIVEDGITGILVSPSDPEGMANAIMKMLANSEMMVSMGIKGNKKSENFDIKKAVERLEALYNYKNLS